MLLKGYKKYGWGIKIDDIIGYENEARAKKAEEEAKKDKEKANKNKKRASKDNQEAKKDESDKDKNSGNSDSGDDSDSTVDMEAEVAKTKAAKTNNSKVPADMIAVLSSKDDGKYTSSKCGQARYGSWDAAGMDEYERLLEKIFNFRKATVKQGDKQVYPYHQVEKHYIDKYKKLNDLRGDNAEEEKEIKRGNKRNREAGVGAAGKKRVKKWQNFE